MPTDQQGEVREPFDPKRVAQEYGRYGWRVVPVRARGKVPLISEWQNAASNDETKIGAWWEQWPDANVGVCLGERSGIIDVEFDSDEGRATAGRLGLDKIVTPTYRSSRSTHRLFRWRNDLPGGATMHLGGLEVRIGNGGKGAQSVFPPSIHPTGVRYEWIISPADAPVAKIPPHVFAFLFNGELPERSDRYRRESNGQASVIDAYNAQTTIEAELRGRRYTQQGDRWRRPGGKSLSVTVNDGRSFHHSANDPLSDGYWHRPFDIFCALEHAGDCKTAVRAAAEQLGIASRQQPDSTEPRDEPRKEFRRITCAELEAGDYRLEYLIDNTLVAGQPCIVAGGKKCLKTSILLDMGIALATGGSLLGRLRVNRRCRVGIMTGESGLATIQETCRRICKAAGYRLADIDGLVFSEDLPRFGNVAHEEALRRFIENDKLEVVVIDPAYLCLPGADAGNLFAQGELLRGMSQVCSDTRCMMVLAHHTRKNKADPFNPPELEDIAWAGFQEFARQWLLVGRREAYEPGSGKHDLWLSVGGSAGHTALWAVSIDEGTRETEGGRFWQVDVQPASQAREDVKTREVQAKALSQQAKLEADKKRLAVVMGFPQYRNGATATDLRDTAKISSSVFNALAAEMLQDRTIEECEVKKSNRKQPYSGYRLIGSAPVEQPEMPGI